MLSSCLNGQTGPHRDARRVRHDGRSAGGLRRTRRLAGPRRPRAPFGAYTDYIAPSSRPPRSSPRSTIAAAPARASTSTSRRPRPRLHFLSPGDPRLHRQRPHLERRGNASLDFAPHGVFPGRWRRPLGRDRGRRTASSGPGCAARSAARSPMTPRFRTNESRLANQEPLEEAIAGWTRTREVEEIERALLDVGVPVHRLVTTFDAFEDPQLAAREHFVQVEHGELGPVPVENSRMRFSATPARVTTAGPTFGQHNQQVLDRVSRPGRGGVRGAPGRGRAAVGPTPVRRPNPRRSGKRRGLVSSSAHQPEE